MAGQHDKDIPQAEAAAVELKIHFYPRGFDTWTGTSAQLIDEGVLPADVEWPERTYHRTWSDGQFEYWLHRERPAGRGDWKDIDYWRVRRTLGCRVRDGFAAARLYEAQKALKAEEFCQSRAGMIQQLQWERAFHDNAFQAFKEKILPERKKPGRRSKSQQG